ncbi:MAG: hypothetical protein K2N99_00200, partial [Malacoplasma sp.]|nr:hypothetical protein [Malacoplasma sp.]
MKINIGNLRDNVIQPGKTIYSEWINIHCQYGELIDNYGLCDDFYNDNQNSYKTTTDLSIMGNQPKNVGQIVRYFTKVVDRLSESVYQLFSNDSKFVREYYDYYSFNISQLHYLSNIIIPRTKNMVDNARTANKIKIDGVPIATDIQNKKNMIANITQKVNTSLNILQGLEKSFDDNDIIPYVTQPYYYNRYYNWKDNVKDYSVAETRIDTGSSAKSTYNACIGAINNFFRSISGVYSKQYVDQGYPIWCGSHFKWDYGDAKSAFENSTLNKGFNLPADAVKDLQNGLDSSSVSNNGLPYMNLVYLTCSENIDMTQNSHVDHNWVDDDYSKSVWNDSYNDGYSMTNFGILVINFESLVKNVAAWYNHLYENNYGSYEYN